MLEKVVSNNKLLSFLQKLFCDCNFLYLQVYIANVIVEVNFLNNLFDSFIL